MASGSGSKQGFGEVMEYDPLIVYPPPNKKVRQQSGNESKRNLIESKKKSVVEIVKEDNAQVVRSNPHPVTRRQVYIT